MKPLCIDLFCGLGGWSEGFLSEGYDVLGFDIKRHRYPRISRESGQVKRPGMNWSGSDKPGYKAEAFNSTTLEFTDEWEEYPGQLVLQDVLTLDGSQFRNAAVIVASPPCQFFSYTAMPWTRAKALAAAVRADPVRLEKELALFKACFRIAAEAGVPLIVENVVGAQSWVGRAAWHYGSFYLWGDVPALMPFSSGMKNSGGSWFGQRDGETLERNDPRDMRRDENGEYVNAEAQGGWNHPGKSLDGTKFAGNGTSPIWSERPHQRDWGLTKGDGGSWFRPGSRDPMARTRGQARKAASAQIAKIPFRLAQWIAKCFKPDVLQSANAGKPVTVSDRQEEH